MKVHRVLGIPAYELKKLSGQKARQCSHGAQFCPAERRVYNERQLSAGGQI